MNETMKKHSCEDQNVLKCVSTNHSPMINPGVCEDQSWQLKKSDLEKYEKGVGSDLSDCLGEVIDIHRTGAKCVSGVDSKLPGAQYHTLAAVRTKPGV